MTAAGDFHSARIMGEWVVDMVDADAALRAVELCRSGTGAVLEVRQTLWGVQVRTASERAATLLAEGYAPAIALAA